MTVTKVFCSGLSLGVSSILGFGRARWDDDVILWQVKIPKSPRTEYACEFVFFIEKWNPLYPTRIDSMSLEHRMIHIAHARKYIRLRIHLEEVWYDELSSTEVDEPVGDDGGAIWCHYVLFKVVSSIIFTEFGFRSIWAYLYLKFHQEYSIILSATQSGSRYSLVFFSSDQNGVFIPLGANTHTLPISISRPSDFPNIPSHAFTVVYIGSYSLAVYWELDVISITFNGFSGFFFNFFTKRIGTYSHISSIFLISLSSILSICHSW